MRSWIGTTGMLLLLAGGGAGPPGKTAPLRPLPAAARGGGVSLTEALARRRSLRRFGERPLELAELSQLLWAAQGTSHEGFKRTAPSAGALYPLEVVVVAGRVRDLPAGVYSYQPERHGLVEVSAGDVRGRLAAAAGRQAWLAHAPAVLVIAGVAARTTAKYGERGVRYVHMEAGAAAENAALQAVALGLGCTFVGAFDDAAAARVAGLGAGERPLLLLPVGPPP